MQFGRWDLQKMLLEEETPSFYLILSPPHLVVVVDFLLLLLLPLQPSNSWNLDQPLDQQAVMFQENSVLSDVCATGISGVVAFSCLGFWGEIGKRGIFDQVTDTLTFIRRLQASPLSQLNLYNNSFVLFFSMSCLIQDLNRTQ